MTEYYARMEAVYLPRFGTFMTDHGACSGDKVSVEAHRKELEDAIRDLYKAILDLQIQSVLRLYSRRFNTFFRDVGQLDDWSSMATVVEDRHSIVKGLVREMRSAQALESLSVMNQQLKNTREAQKQWTLHFSELLGTLGAIRDNLEDLAAKQNAYNEGQQAATQKVHDLMTAVVNEESTRGLNQFLTALDEQTSSGESIHQMKNKNPRLLDNTGNWVLQNSSYTQWLQSRSGILVISCPPGCGKSVLSRHLIDTALLAAGRSIVTYFFFDQATVAQALCAVLQQLYMFDQNLALSAIKLHEKQPSLFSRRDLLWELLDKSFGALGTATVVLDAIDQCVEEDAAEFFQSSMESGRSNVHLVLTTRPYCYVTAPLESTDVLHVSHIRGEDEEAMTRITHEIRCVIHHEILRLRWPDRWKQLLEERMMRVRNPTYLRVRLIFESVQPSRHHHFHPTMANIEKLVTSLPATFAEKYDQILMASPSLDKLRLAMSIIIAAPYPLTLR